MNIDFSLIRSAPKSRNDSFEALAVQLFRKTCRVPTNSTFISLRGDGGDGGVEAYFRSPDGAVFGVQAKYFFQLASAELTQIDNSLKAALSNHPTLTEYWIYIPFDLTGRVAAGKRGKSQAERFEEWKSKVESEASAKGKSLSIVLCTAAVICNQLLEIDPYGGMRRYWFDDTLLTAAQIQQCLDDAIAFAGPRYTSMLDVVTNAHVGLDFFGGTGDFCEWYETSLTPIVREFHSLNGYGRKSLDILGETRATSATALIEEIIAYCESMRDNNVTATLVTDLCVALSSLLTLFADTRHAQEDKFYEKHGKHSDTESFRQFHAEYMCAFPAGDMDAARKWEEQAQQLQNLLTSQVIGAATAHSLLLVGPAGIGKTHAIVSAALRRLEHGGFSLVVFGDDFGKAEPWEVLRSKIGLGAAIDRSTLFECIQACAEHTGLPFVIYIDALNESPREVRWKDKLPELLAQCKSYPDIKICVSTRDTYRNLVVDSRFPGFAFEHIGFSGQQFEAVQAFAAYYGLDAEITPLFSPELSNPLFLHLACKTLKGEGRDSLDISLPGFTSLFQGHLKYCDVLIRERLHYANPRNLVRAAMMALANTLTHELPQNRTWETCCEALSRIVGTEATPESLLNALEHEGLIILSVVDEDTFLIRLGYQRYGDILRAISLVEALDSDTAKLAEKIAALTEEDAGLLEALAAVLPEKAALEITAEEVGLPSEQAHKLFIQSLVWRSRQSLVEEIDEHIHAALHIPGLWESVYEALFSLSLVPDHRLNATNWLGPFLRQSSLAERDTYLSLAALGSFDNKTAVYSLIHAALFADITHWPAESRRLASLTLAWLTSCADRRIRDLSSKGLSRILANYPENCKTVISEFAYCNDDYVLERISLAIYSACLLARQRRNAFIPALPDLLSIASDSANILLRDTVRLLVNLLKTEEFPTNVTSQLQHYQTNVSLPSRWPVLADVKPLLDLEHLPSNMVLWGESMAPDFWRYQVESKISGFDLKSANISHENIACWLMREALNLGYPGYNHCALNYDRHIGSQYGAGRGRKGYADRLGKKYYWIALHRLQGILASNVPALEDPYSDYEPTSDHLWSVDVRKVDLTDVRDITAEGVYPVLMEETNYAFPDHNSDIKGWVRTDDFPPYEACLIRTDEEGEQWVALSHSYWDDDKAPNENSWDSPYLGVRASYSSALINESIQNFKQKRARDIFQYNQGSSCYRGYLAEYPDSPVYKQLLNSDEDSEAFNFTEVSLLRGNEWEYDYSYTMPERQDNLIAPCLGIIQKLELLWDCQSGWVDHSGKLIAFHQKGVKQRGLFIHRSALNAYLSITGEELIHRRFANRGYFDLAGRNSTQIDLKTWIQYRADKAPVVLREEELPFNC